LAETCTTQKSKANKALKEHQQYLAVSAALLPLPCHEACAQARQHNAMPLIHDKAAAPMYQSYDAAA
jgi:hypothetical protein